MPRAFDAEERARVIEALLEAGRERFIQHGLSRVTVGELSEAAGIGKGTFYLFFDGKEAMFLALVEREEAAARATLEAGLFGLEGEALLEALFTRQLALLERHPFLSLLLDEATTRALALKLDPARMAAHRAGDRGWLVGLARRWQAEGRLPASLDPEALYALSAALFLTSSQRRLMGGEWPLIARTLPGALARGLIAEGAEGPAQSGRGQAS